MSNENLGALLAAFDDDNDENSDDTFVTAANDLTSMDDTFTTCLDRNETQGQSSFEEFYDVGDIEDDFTEEDADRDLTPKASLATPDRLRELIKESRAIVNSQTPPTKHETSNVFPFSSDSFRNSSKQTPSTSDLSKKAAAIGKALTKDSDKKRAEIFDPLFGIRVDNPKISLTTFSTYCTGFKKIRVSHLRRTNIPKEDWVTMGVIVEKSEFRKSANGHEYMIWKVSDLTNFQDTPVKVLLFGECVKQHWKLQQSCVVALTSPQVTDDNKLVTLKVAKSAQVIEIGFCPDFGICRSVKQDGEKCKNYVNTNTSEFCVYHIQKAAKTTLGQRAGLSSPYNSPIGCRISKPKMAVRNGETKVVGNTHSFLSASKVINKVELDVKPKIPTKSISKDEFKALKEQENEKLQAVLQGNKVNFGAKNLLKHRSEKDDIVKNAALKPKPKEPIDVRAFLRDQKRELLKSQSFKSGGELELIGAPTNGKPKTPAEINRQKLAARIKAQGGLPKVDPNQTRKRAADQMTPSKPSTSSVFNQEFDEPAPEAAKKSKLGKEYSSADIQALLGKKSTHENVIEAADRSKEDSYFSSMEVREKIETRLTELSEIKDVKVVTCKKCDYTSEKQSSFCMINGHLVHWHQANKRFFKCAACKQRVTIFAIMPIKPCNNCGCTSWMRVGMRDERTVKEDKLVIRGDEVPFVNR